MAGRKNPSAASPSYLRIQNTAVEQTVKSSAGLLRRIVASNANAAVQTVTVKDATTTIGVYKIPANDTRVLEFGLDIGTSLKVTNSDTAQDTLVVYS